VKVYLKICVHHFEDTDTREHTH